jgi:anaerobic selenocysteine-containing dehydrogenase/Fe-S-cluster-containing dehydrogenase component
MSGMDRRSFFKVVATTGAAAAAGGCGPSAEQLIPYVIPPDNIVPGIPAYFSTVCRECPSGCGLIAKNRDGRVIKLEGNPDHPSNTGGLCVRAHAGLQGLYHPDRFLGPLGGGKPTTWDEAQKQLADKLGELAKARRGARIAVVSGLETGSLGRLMDEWVRLMGARPRIAYEPLGYEAIRAANRVSFGRDTIPDYRIGDATYLVSFGADFLETWLNCEGYTADFSRMHAFHQGKQGTFVHVEPRFSLTAANADQWLRNAPGTEGLLALAMLKVIVDEGLQASGVDVATLRAAVRSASVESASIASGIPAETIKRVALELGRARAGLVLGGGVASSGSTATDGLVAVNLLNAAIGAIGSRVRFGSASPFGRVSPYSDMVALTQAMAAGQIDVLLLVDVNPVYAMPPKSGFAEALAKVPMVVALAGRPNETTARAHLVLPTLHPLESWGDYMAEEGVLGLMQPTMGPVQVEGKPVAAKATGDVFLALGRAALGLEEGKGPLRWSAFQDYLKDEWQKLAKEQGATAAFSDYWEAALRRGGAWRTPSTPAPALRSEAGRIQPGAPKLDGDGSHTLLVYPSLRFYDGRGADRPWLQEMPDSITQVSWDGWVEVPTETAQKMGLKRGDLVKLTSPHGAIELPAYPTDLVHPGVVAVAMGLGHKFPGTFARQGTHAPGTVSQPEYLNTGANPIELLPATPDTASGGLPYLAVKVALTATGGRRPLAVPQAQFDQDEREIAQWVELGAARELDLRGRAPEHASRPSMYPARKFPEYRWGMTVDVDRCTGCQACVLACQSENNVPVVGKAQIAYGRQMNWMRIERWQEGTAAKPTNIFLPMFCQHCEVAPCEPVCPVYAAYQTKEGLNGQVYNRCVGTRYCGNNCPYHVRRFNWFNFTWSPPLDLQLNPDVTVRQLGVMEKCTMCLQRIVAAKDFAREAGRPVQDGDMETACQQTCPTRAITFGNLKDERSLVSRLSLSTRGYHVLEGLGTTPAVTYLKKVVRAAPAAAHGEGEHKV